MTTTDHNTACNRCHKVGHVLESPYDTVDLHVKTERHLRKTSFKTLCPSCLVELNSMVIQATHERFPATGKDMKLGKHYYMNGDFMVMTEYYHIARGFCCGSGCKHCAYGSDGSKNVSSR